VRLQQDARARCCPGRYAPESSHHVPHPGGERSIDALGERFGRAEEDRPLELEQQDATAVLCEQGGFAHRARARAGASSPYRSPRTTERLMRKTNSHHRHADADQRGDATSPTIAVTATAGSRP